MDRADPVDRKGLMAVPTKPQRAGDQSLPYDGQVDVGPEVVADVLRYEGFRDKRIIQQVADDFRARIQLGIERYGHPLQTHNGRDAVRDALDEALDLAHYLKQLEIETHDPKVSIMYACAIGIVFDLEEWIAAQEPAPA